jgi:hypothetical protein
MTEAPSKGKPLSEKPLGYLLAAAGGLLGGPLGVILSLAVLISLTAIMKPKDGKHPNRFLAWSLVGIVGVPISLAPTLPSSDKATNKKKVETTISSESNIQNAVPVGVEQSVREDRSLTVNRSSELYSITAKNEFFEPVLPKGGKLIAVYMTIRNTGNESGNLFWTRFQLVDDQGRKYDDIEDFREVVTVNAWAKDQGMAETGDQLFPGALAETVLVFRVSPDAAGLRLFVNNEKLFTLY